MLKLDIITPVRNAFSEDVEFVSVPTKMGTVGYCLIMSDFFGTLRVR